MSANAPPHLRDHVWSTMDGWLEAEAQTALNKQRAADFKSEGPASSSAASGLTIDTAAAAAANNNSSETQNVMYFPRLAHKRRADQRPMERSGINRDAATGLPEPLTHVPGEDPAKWERAHHFKRFASRPEMIHDSVWACTGYTQQGLPAALAKLIPAHSPIRGQLKKTSSSARDQLVADGSLPPPLPKYRRLWEFQRRELTLSKKLTVPPRPPLGLSDKYPEHAIIEPAAAAAAASGGGGGGGGGAPRDSCVAGCCACCGSNMRPWNGLGMNVSKQQQQQLQRQREEKHRGPVVRIPRSYIVPGTPTGAAAISAAAAKKLSANAATAAATAAAAADGRPLGVPPGVRLLARPPSGQPPKRAQSAKVRQTRPLA